MFGEVLRTLRRRRGLTQDELAERAGVNLRTIGKLELQQITTPRPGTVRLIAEALELVGDERERFLAAAGHTPQHSLGRDGALVPAQLPSGVAGFVGRHRQFTELNEMLDDAGEVMPIAAIGGTAGVGKTALAIQWARQVRHRFPDGQLYINLRGYDVEGPLAPNDALAAFLRALGTRPDDIPLELEERAAAYRSRLEGRRVLVVLDNASTVEQVRPLLPGAPSCMTLVSSRESLGGLVARYGARRVELDLLSLDESIELLRSLIGDRAEAEAECVAVLAERCARLPLALRVAAERAVSHPDTPLSALVAGLADQQRRLELLDTDDDARTSVRAVFSWSYTDLPAGTARMFRLVGRHPGLDIDVDAAAAAADIRPEQASDRLEQLARAHLVHRTAPDRYGMHDLLSAYARSLVDDESEVERWAASRRLYEYYIATADAMIARLFHESHNPVMLRLPTETIGQDQDEVTVAARAWLEREMENLVAIAAHATEHGETSVAPRLAAMLFSYLFQFGRLDAVETLQRHARAAARAAGDSTAEVRAMVEQAVAYGRHGRHDQAEELFDLTIAKAREMGDTATELRALRNLALIAWHRGRGQQALDISAQVLAESGGNEPGIVLSVLGNRAAFLWRLGRLEEALADLDEAAVLVEQHKVPHSAAQIHLTYGEIYRQLGRLTEAKQHVQAALEVATFAADPVDEGIAVRDLGSLSVCAGDLEAAVRYFHRAIALLGGRYPWGEAHALARLGDCRRRQGDLAQAAELQERALAHFRSNRDPSGEGEVLNHLGRTRCDQGDLESAREAFTRALALAVRAGIRFEEAGAREGLGWVYTAAGFDEFAAEHLRQARGIHDELGTPASLRYTWTPTADRSVFQEN